MTELLAGLNSEQQRAVLHDRGPLFVAAGPGSGKTRVITYRIAYQVLSGSRDPERLFGITFTQKAAAELRQRLKILLGPDVPSQVGTFHWACHAILRRYGDRIGLPRGFRLLSPSESRLLFRESVAAGSTARRGALLSAVSSLKNGADLQAASRQYDVPGEAVLQARAAYDRRLGSMTALDLDDLLAQTHRLLLEDAEVRARCQATHDEILVDEFQDTNPVQHSLVELLAPRSRTVIAVGDPNQAIYGWRQADSRSRERFFDAFPEANVVHLNRSYRSTKRILRAASALIAHNEGRLVGDMRTENGAGSYPVCLAADDEREEAEWIAREIKRLDVAGVASADIAVLYRVNVQSRPLEEALVRHAIPYHVVGAARFYDREEVRVAVAYLRLIEGDDDDAAALIASTVRGIGERRVERLKVAAERASVPLLGAFSLPNVVPDAPSSVLKEMAATIQRLRQLKREPLHAVVDAVIETVLATLTALSPLELEAASENLSELRSVVAEIGPRARLRDLLDRLGLVTESGPGTGVALMTLHAAKGLEFPAVFVVGLEEGLLPHGRALSSPESIEEERRLCYVGMTRAREYLYLTYAHTRLLGGSAAASPPSRFITEIGPDRLTTELSSRRKHRPRLQSAAAGDRVRHPRWGDGLVVSVAGIGPDALVTVQFNGTTRRVLLRHAPLVRLPDGPDVLAG